MSAVLILMNDYGGYAFPVELSLELIKRGYSILHVYTSASGSPTAAFPSGTAGFESIDIDLMPVQKDNFFQRWKNERQYGAKVAAIIRERNPAMVISANTPLEAQKQIMGACQIIHAKFIYWLQDFLSIAAKRVLSKKLGALGALAGFYFSSIEKKLLRQSDAIVVIADAFAAFLQKWRIDNKSIFVIPNWAPIEYIPVRNKINDFSRQYGIDEKFVVLYSGTMGMKQNPDIVVQAALELAARSEIVFVVISNGVGMDYLKQKKLEHKLDNLLLLPLQPFRRISDCLASADVGLVLLDADAGDYCVPSKLWSIFCSQRAALLVVPTSNLAAHVTKTQDAGIVLEPHDAAKLAATVLQLSSQPDLLKTMGKNGRAFAENNFRIKSIADQFEEVIKSVN